MKIGLLVLDFHLEGCRSLKEKRRRLLGIRDKIGKNPNVALCESDYQNNHQAAQWAFVALSYDGRVADQILDSIEEQIDATVDAYISNTHRTHL